MVDLKYVITKHPNCLSSRSLLRSLLLDYFPKERQTINILIHIYEYGLVKVIKSKPVLTDYDLRNMARAIEIEYGVIAALSKQAIVLWAEALDIPLEQGNTLGESDEKKQHEIISVKSKRVFINEDSSQESIFAEMHKVVADFVCVLSQIYNKKKSMAAPCDNVDPNDYQLVKRADGYYIERFVGFEEDVMIVPSCVKDIHIKGIAKGAYRGCVSVKEIYIMNGIEIIEGFAFEGCSSLSKVILPDSLNSIGLPNEKDGGSTFSSTNIEAIRIPPNVVFVGADTFSFCSNLRTVVFTGSVTELNQDIFAYCESLKDISLPQTLIRIKRRAFYGCHALKSLYIPQGVEIIEKDAFQLCAFSDIYLPPSLVQIGEHKKGYPITTAIDDTFGRLEDRISMVFHCVAGSLAMEYARSHYIKCVKATY